VKTKSVPVSDPSHPSHASALSIIMKALEFAIAIGPVVVAIADPADAQLAKSFGAIAAAGLAAQSGEQ
jgi:hypothetical protein